ncbi:MAG: PRC-barrel domain-containing protein [Methanotrichaceae archaeon]|nr:PRC-barrel domain-containing protein [Methanotrichaceae archaeon]
MKGASRIFANSVAGKEVMDINGGVIGEVENLIFDIKTGQIIDIVIKPDSKLPKGKYKEENKFILIPFGSVSAVKDVIVVDNSSIDRK